MVVSRVSRQALLASCEKQDDFSKSEPNERRRDDQGEHSNPIQLTLEYSGSPSRAGPELKTSEET